MHRRSTSPSPAFARSEELRGRIGPHGGGRERAAVAVREADEGPGAGGGHHSRRAQPARGNPSGRTLLFDFDFDFDLDVIDLGFFLVAWIRDSGAARFWESRAFLLFLRCAVVRIVNLKRSCRGSIGIFGDGKWECGRECGWEWLLFVGQVRTLISTVAALFSVGWGTKREFLQPEMRKGTMEKLELRDREFFVLEIMF